MHIRLIIHTGFYFSAYQHYITKIATICIFSQLQVYIFTLLFDKKLIFENIKIDQLINY